MSDDSARIGAADLGDSLSMCQHYACHCDPAIDEPMSDTEVTTLEWWSAATWLPRGEG